MTDEAAELETYQRARIEAAARGLERRARIILPAWIAMLDALETGERKAEFVDWFEIEREDGRDADIGLWRHCGSIPPFHWLWRCWRLRMVR